MLALGAEEDNDDSCTTRAARCREAGAPASQTAATGGAAGVGRRRRGQWQPLRWPEGAAATPVVAATVAEAEASELVAAWLDDGSSGCCGTVRGGTVVRSAAAAAVAVTAVTEGMAASDG
uniref:DUF834 domain-containing protein n=1 Tax=Oryza rufipogon TaxID=4529 RepID=A0A0E0QZQ7_ORYRU